MKFSFLGMSITAVVLATISGAGALFLKRSFEITCMRGGAVSDATCQMTETFMMAAWFLPGIFTFAAIIYMALHFMTSEVTGFGSDDHFG